MRLSGFYIGLDKSGIYLFSYYCLPLSVVWPLGGEIFTGSIGVLGGIGISGIYGDFPNYGTFSYLESIFFMKFF